MPTPKYTKLNIFDKDQGQWVTEITKSIDGVEGKIVKILIDPDLTPVFEYQETVIDEEGKPKVETKQKSDWKEEQTFFIPAGEDEDKILSAACWNHMHGIEKRFQEIPAKPENGPAKEALSEDQIS